jgi:hypothetical protein
MRFERMVLGIGLVAAVVVSGCGTVLGGPPDGGGGGSGGHDAGGDTGGVPCRQLTEEACRARTDCAVGSCSLCGASSMYAGCYQPGVDPTPVCAGIACPVQCNGLDETSCRANLGCRANTCPDCNGGTYFTNCTFAGDQSHTCPAILCPLPCAQETTKDACDARPDCHSVYFDPQTCGCAALGCCAHFSRCADGGTAVCSPPPTLCTALAPHCEGDYVVSYSGGCYEGCVASTACPIR